MDAPRQDTRSPTGVDQLIGQRIRLARKRAKLSQTELGQAIGVTYQQVQKYENGTDRVAASRLFQIAKVLEVTPAALLVETEEEVGASPLLDEMAMSLAAEFSRIKSPALRKAALDAMKAIVASERAA
jgi:transcriptional regulator with XRE-family HTH domain